MFKKHVFLGLYLIAGVVLGYLTPAIAEDKTIEICSLVTQEQLGSIYRKPLYPKAYNRQCLWSIKQGGMAYLDIQYHKYRKDLREYFNVQLSDNVALEKIADLGDGGLMSVVDGSLGVIVIRKGDLVLQSAATFLDIELGSDQQKVLWDIYREILKRL